MALQINQFAQAPVQGQMDLSIGGGVVSARVSNNIGNGVTLIAGQAVKGDVTLPGTAQDGIPPVLPLASNSDPAIGFVVRNIKDQSFGANARLELALSDSYMYMTSDSTTVGIARFAPVEYNATANTVLTWQGVNPIVGYAWDAAILAGDIIRVRISSPQLSAVNTNQSIKSLSVTATLAQINAGQVIIPGVAGKKIIVEEFIAHVTGTFTTGTSIELESTNATPVAVVTIAEAALTGGAVITQNSSNVTLGAGYGAPLGSGDGLTLVNNGTAQAGGTSVTFNIQYTQA